MKLWTTSKPNEAAPAAPAYPGVLQALDGSSAVVAMETAGSEAAGAYPITPSTQMGEGWAVAVAEGKRNVNGRRLLFFEPEGEHAAAAVTAGMSMAGLRATNFSSGQGIAYMHESLYAAVGKRLTYVLNVAARAMTKHALNVHAGHDDYHAVDDTGFFQLFAKDVQECADLNLIAHRVAELSLNPGIIAQDGFLTSHVIESLRLPERDLIKACRRMGIRSRLVAKGPGVRPPLRGDWKALIDRHIDLGCEVISPIFKWTYEDTISDFSAGLSKETILDSITESIQYMKRQQVRVVPWMEDSMRANTATACLFYKAMTDAGADGVYTVDSRGNSTPLATRVYISRIREAVGEKCDVYVQHHNDLGVATANAMAAAEAGANWIDASVIGIGDRGGCVALEEAAALFEMYGIATGIKLEKLYELCLYVQQAYGIALPPWKPIVGSNWNKEEGVGHLEGSDNAEATIGIAPRVIGREFEAVIGGKILFGRERSSAHTDDPVLLRELMSKWNYAPSEEQFQTVLFRSRAAVASYYGRHYLTFDEFRSICDGVMHAAHEQRTNQ